MTRVRGLLRIAGAMQTLWTLLGLTLLLLLLLECGAAAVYGLTDRFSRGHRRSAMDSFRGADWAPAYFAELERSLALDWRSYVYWRRKPFHGRYIQVDAAGIRRTWQPEPAGRAAPRRVFMFGGSTLWGMGARDEFTIPSFVAKGVAERLPGHAVHVTNFAELGYVSTQGLLALQVELQHGNVPDLVVFYDGVNDVASAFQNGIAGIPQNESNRRIEFEGFPKAWVHQLVKDSSLMRPILWRLGERIWQEEKQRRGPEQSRALARQAVEVYARNLGMVQALAATFGFESLFYWQPVVFTKSPLTADEQAAARIHEFMREFFLQAYGDVAEHPELRGSARFHDLGRIFEGEAQPLYFDFCHITEEGNRRVAEAMLPAVLRTLEVRAPER